MIIFCLTFIKWRGNIFSSMVARFKLSHQQKTAAKNGLRRYNKNGLKFPRLLRERERERERRTLDRTKNAFYGWVAPVLIVVPFHRSMIAYILSVNQCFSARSLERALNRAESSGRYENLFSDHIHSAFYSQLIAKLCKNHLNPSL